MGKGGVGLGVRRAASSWGQRRIMSIDGESETRTFVADGGSRSGVRAVQGNARVAYQKAVRSSRRILDLVHVSWRSSLSGGHYLRVT